MLAKETNVAQTTIPLKPDRDASPAVGRTLTVLEVLVDRGEPLTLTALSKETGIALATCGAIMQTLELRGYAARRVVGRSHFWRPTLRLYSLATNLVRQDDLAGLAAPELRSLADQLDMPAHIGVLDGTNVVYLAKAAPQRYIQFNTYPGKVSPFNLTALGRAIVAFLPAEVTAPLLKHAVPGDGPRAHGATPLIDQLGEIRRQGFAVEDEEEEEGITCLAAPIRSADGSVVAAVGVTGFSNQLSVPKRPRVASLVADAATSISSRLGYVAQRSAPPGALGRYGSRRASGSHSTL
jgi:DNA-binding IclR family transcriptional regulator